MILYFDIETVPEYESVEHGGNDYYNNWFQFAKSRKLITDDVTIEQSYQNNAALYAEFCMIVCIAMGYYKEVPQTKILLSRGLDEERQMLKEFAETAIKFEYLCAYNGKNFDFPITMRRMLFSHVSIPTQLKTFNVKPWEMKLIDPCEMYRGTQFRHTVKHELLCHRLGIECKSDGIHGDAVRDLFRNKQYDVIVKYGTEDVLSLMHQHKKLEAALL